MLLQNAGLAGIINVFRQGIDRRIAYSLINNDTLHMNCTVILKSAF